MKQTCFKRVGAFQCRILNVCKLFSRHFHSLTTASKDNQFMYHALKRIRTQFALQKMLKAKVCFLIAEPSCCLGHGQPVKFNCTFDGFFQDIYKKT